MEFKLQLPRPGFAERSSKMYILPTLTYLEVGGPAGASEIICFEHFNYEPIQRVIASGGMRCKQDAPPRIGAAQSLSY